MSHVKNERMLELDLGCVKTEHKTIIGKKFGSDTLAIFLIIINEQESIFQPTPNIRLF